jgi:hypothetical protein
MLELTVITKYFQDCLAAFRDRSESHRITCYVALADRDPGTPVHFYRLAAACLDGGSRALWQRGVELASQLPHDTPRSQCDRGDARLRLGEWSAWRDLEWREYHSDWGISHASSLSWTHRRWDGTEDLSNKTLLVIHLGGFGDALWSLRFVESLRDRVQRVLWDTPPGLVELVQHNVGALVHVGAFNERQASMRFDRYMYAMSLPYVLGRMPPFVRRTAPAPSAKRLASASTRARIGLAWSCSLDGLDHLERSVPLSILAPLFWRSDLEWYSLQVGARATDGDYYPGIRKPDPPLRTFADTANLIAGLDGVIAVDTSVAHLAGSLAVPTLTLLRFACDSKWGPDDTTPWYPSMHLIRQHAPGDWPSIVDNVRAALGSNWWMRAHDDGDLAVGCLTRSALT